jgi:glycolate oxidase FAD binding subunit
LAYEPNDLTISVGAGIPFKALKATLHEQGQFVPLDAPFAENATIGGVVAANNSGPRRRRYGTARDMVIGMTFATVAGKLVKSGGMVVKNVTGLDMGKLMIGSFGTLGAMTSINFKVSPRPTEERSFLAFADSLDSLLTLSSAIVKSQLQPVSIDLLDGGASALAGLRGNKYCLALEANGNKSLVDRYEREWAGLAKENGASDFQALDQAGAESFWRKISEFPALATADSTSASILRVAAEPKKLGDMLTTIGSAGASAIVTRAAAGISYVGCPDLDSTQRCVTACRTQGFPTIIESCPADQKEALELWPHPGSQFAVMQRIKDQLDPDHFLNPGRLYNLI